MLLGLPDGTRVVVRTITPADKDRLSEGLARLSSDAVHSRFLSAKPRLTGQELRYLTEVDGDSHFALVAMLSDRLDALVAVARYVRLADDPSTAEVAVTVGDELQGRGLGTRLGLLLADHARDSGIERFSASMLTDNVAAHRLFSRISHRMSRDRFGAVDEVVAELAA